MNALVWAVGGVILVSFIYSPFLCVCARERERGRKGDLAGSVAGGAREAEVGKRIELICGLLGDFSISMGEFISLYFIILYFLSSFEFQGSPEGWKI